MSAVGNFVWFITGGILMGLFWCLFGVMAYLSIFGIPWGKACFVIAQFTFFPFGKTAISRSELNLKQDIGTGNWGMAGNLIWFLFAGVWLAMFHLIWALANFTTVIFIPFGIQHLKLASIALAPIGKTIVSNEVAKAAMEANAKLKVEKLRLTN
jgi:uncharacterized membrane protein YccF (DUF307 family)